MLTTDRKMAMLTNVNRYVNAHVKQVSDSERYGQAEYWLASGTGKKAAGDCEDIALEKRNQLIEQGCLKKEMFVRTTLAPIPVPPPVTIATAPCIASVMSLSRFEDRVWHSAVCCTSILECPEPSPPPRCSTATSPPSPI